MVVKIGTTTLTNTAGQNNLRSFDRFARVLSDAQNMGYEIILVSSGAVAVGENKLKIRTASSAIPLKQASAAIGQCSMMHLYDKFFSDYDKTIAQILLNAEDLEIPERKRNLINTFNTLLDLDIIPIVNENDSISYTEIESKERLFSDNDMLSAIVAVLCRAQKLIIFSDIDGFYNKDPRVCADAQLIKRVGIIDQKVHSLAGSAGSRRGTGGMKTKLQAAELATAQGIDTIITNGKNPSALYEIIKGRSVGTLFAGNQPECSVSL